jgi:hypothetical protein
MFKSFSTRVRGIKIGQLEQQTLIGSTDQSTTVPGMRYKKSKESVYLDKLLKSFLKFHTKLGLSIPKRIKWDY